MERNCFIRACSSQGISLAHNGARRRRPSEPCWSERIYEECPSCPNHHQESGVGQTDRRPRNASTIQSRHMLHWRQWSCDCTRAQRGLDVHIGHQLCQHRYVCQGTISWVRYKAMTQTFGNINFPKLRDMQSKQVVFSLPKFSDHKGRTCEACQLGKPHQQPFPMSAIKIATS